MKPHGKQLCQESGGEKSPEHLKGLKPLSFVCLFVFFFILRIKQKKGSSFHLHAKERNYSKTSTRMPLAAPKHIEIPPLIQQEGADSIGISCAMHLAWQEWEHIPYGQG